MANPAGTALSMVDQVEAASAVDVDAFHDGSASIDKLFCLQRAPTAPPSGRLPTVAPAHPLPLREFGFARSCPHKAPRSLPKLDLRLTRRLEGCSSATHRRHWLAACPAARLGSRITCVDRCGARLATNDRRPQMSMRDTVPPGFPDRMRALAAALPSQSVRRKSHTFRRRSASYLSARSCSRRVVTSSK